jgi:hypothetical protein
MTQEKNLQNKVYFLGIDVFPGWDRSFHTFPSSMLQKLYYILSAAGLSSST